MAVVILLIGSTSSTYGQTSTKTLGDWCQAPSWAFGLPNIVTYMGIVGIIAIFSTLITIVVQSRQKPLPITHERRPGPPDERSAAGGVDKKIFTDRNGKKWQIEEGANHHFLIFQNGKTYSASHDGSWREVTIRFEGENYLYTDNSGKGRYLCTRPGAPFGNFFKLESPAQVGAEV